MPIGCSEHSSTILFEMQVEVAPVSHMAWQAHFFGCMVFKAGSNAWDTTVSVLSTLVRPLNFTVNDDVPGRVFI
jgi:hypothetical protein